MYPKPIQKLIDLFTKLPGIGPRQAARFAFFVLNENSSYTTELISTLNEVSRNVSFCTQCFRSIDTNGGKVTLCSLCQDSRRDLSLVAVVEKESDMQNLEKIKQFSGLYHVLGGVIAPLDSSSPARLHLKELHKRVQSILGNERKCEVVLATNPTTEGDATALYIERILAPLQNQFPDLKISRLGRGLSLGSELEHVDEVTLKNALTNRK